MHENAGNWMCLPQGVPRRMRVTSSTIHTESVGSNDLPGLLLTYDERWAHEIRGRYAVLDPTRQYSWDRSFPVHYYGSCPSSCSCRRRFSRRPGEGELGELEQKILCSGVFYEEQWSSESTSCTSWRPYLWPTPSCNTLLWCLRNNKETEAIRIVIIQKGSFAIIWEKSLEKWK